MFHLLDPRRTYRCILEFLCSASARVRRKARDMRIQSNATTPFHFCGHCSSCAIFRFHSVLVDQFSIGCSKAPLSTVVGQTHMQTRRTSEIETIAEIHQQLDPIWPTGRRQDAVAGSGPNWVLRGTNRPVSVDELEGRFLCEIVSQTNRKNVVEIGTGFGYSAFWIALGLFRTPKSAGEVHSFDTLQEGGIGRKGHEFAQSIAEMCSFGQLMNFHIGSSREIGKNFLRPRSIDLVFIDGDHNDGQPYQDYLSLKPFLTDDAIVVWHDHDDRYSVPDDVNRVCRDGYEKLIFRSSCQMAVTVRDPRWSQPVKDAFQTSCEAKA